MAGQGEEKDKGGGQELQPSSSPRPGSVQGVVTSEINLNLSPQLSASAMLNPTPYNIAISPQPGSSARTNQVQGVARPGLPPFDAQAPQPDSSAGLIPAQGEAKREALSPETQVAATQQTEGNILPSNPQTSCAMPALSQSLRGRRPHSPATAPQLSSSTTAQERRLTFPEAQVAAKRRRTPTGSLPEAWSSSFASRDSNQGVVQPDLPPPGAQVVATQQREVPTPHLTALRTASAPQPSSSARQIPVQREDGTELLSPEAQTATMQQQWEGNIFVEPQWPSYVDPVSAQDLEDIDPYFPYAAPRMSSSAAPLGFPEAWSSPGDDQRLNILQYWREQVRLGKATWQYLLRAALISRQDLIKLGTPQELLDSGITTDILPSTPSAYQRTPTETQTEMLGDETGDTSGKRDSEGEKNEDTEVSSEASLGLKPPSLGKAE